MFYLITGLVITLLLALLIERSYQSHRLKNKVLDLEKRISNREESQKEFSLGHLQSNKELPSGTLRDPLTDLLGKPVFDDRFSLLLNQSERFDKAFGLLMLNIDDFTAVNKNHGYEVGDIVLKEIGSRLKMAIRQIDTIAHFAADSFVFLLPQLTMPETAVYVAQRLLDLSVLPIQVEDKSITLTACIGIAIYPHDGKNTNELLKNAEHALKQAKMNGKGIYQFYQKETQLLGENELILKSCIQSAEFLSSLSMTYKIYSNTMTKEDICLQANPYLKHPKLGVISFHDFYRIIENCGKTAEYCEWSMRHAVNWFSTVATEPSHPKELILTFTLKQIDNPDFMNKLPELIKELKIEPSKLVFEVVEDVVDINTASLKKSLLALAALNVKISIGIFMLGHCALHKIKNITINYLKVDNKLINGLDTHAESRDILEQIIYLAKNLKIDVLTEGVEAEHQKVFLEGLGCYVMEGNLFKDKLRKKRTMLI